MGIIALLGLGACTPHNYVDDKLRYDGRYWQRADTTSAIYMKGPKATQMLQRDIARCTVELNELERLGVLKETMPNTRHRSGGRADQRRPEDRIGQWQTPERDGYLRMEDMDYHDFETCMHAKGWERVEYLPYKRAERARDDYLQAIIGQERRTRIGERYDQPQDDYSGLND